MACQSIHIQAWQTATSTDDVPPSSASTDRFWCSYRGYDDGRLMLLYCDKQTAGCCIWYDYDCLGIPLPDALQLGASKDGFNVSPHCSAAVSNV